MLQHLWSTGWSSEVFQVLDSTDAESVEQKLVSCLMKLCQKNGRATWKQQHCSKREELHSKQSTAFLQGRYLEKTLGTRRDLYDRLPEFFRSWADGNVVLMGDAVHPMMPNLGQGGCQAIEDGRNQPDVVIFGHKKLHFCVFFSGWIQDMQDKTLTKPWQILNKLWNFDREMIFDERSHPKMCHAMWGCLRAHTHLICQQNLRRRLWSKGGWDFFNSAQPPVKDQSVWINDYSSTIAPLEDYFPKLLGVSRSQKYHFRVGAFRSEWLNRHGIFETPAGDRRGSAELL